MNYLGCNVYHWGEQEENRLLVECLGPLAREALVAGLAEHFWFTRFDARGPHVFAVLSAAPRSLHRLRAELSARLARYLGRHPSTLRLERRVLEERHRQCRGKVICGADTRPGLAANNSFTVFEHPSDGYPFALSRDLAAREELWQLVTEFTLWAIERLAQGGTIAAAVRWQASLDRALQRAGADPAQYWCYYATTLILPLSERLRKTEAEVLGALPGAVGARNAALFSRLWDAPEPSPWPRVGRLAEILVNAEKRGGQRRWALLRELNHHILAQLGQPVRSRIPQVLYAWQRNLSRSVAA